MNLWSAYIPVFPDSVFVLFLYTSASSLKLDSLNRITYRNDEPQGYFKSNYKDSTKK